jgi:hypothetical protein
MTAQVQMAQQMAMEKLSITKKTGLSRFFSGS